jgi:hypothetical protein
MLGTGRGPSTYPLVRDTLVEAMGRTAGAGWDDRLAEDWRGAIDVIGRQMIAGANAGLGVLGTAEPSAAGTR